MKNIILKTGLPLLLIFMSCNPKKNESKINSNDTLVVNYSKPKVESQPDTICELLIKNVTDKFEKRNYISSKFIKSQDSDSCIEFYTRIEKSVRNNGNDVWFYFSVLGKPLCLDSKFGVYFLFENNVSLRTVGLSDMNCKGSGGFPFDGSYDNSKEILKQLSKSKLKSIRIEGDYYADFDLSLKASTELFYSIKCIKNQL